MGTFKSSAEFHFLTVRSKPNAIIQRIAAAIMMPLSILGRCLGRQLGYQFRPKNSCWKRATDG